MTDSEYITFDAVADIPELLNATIYICKGGCNRKFVYSNETEPWDASFGDPLFCPCCGRCATT